MQAFNKIVSSILLSLIIWVLTSLIGEIAYIPQDDFYKRGYLVEVASNAPKEKKSVPLAELLRMFTVADGEKIAKGKCASCHSFDKNGSNKTGPNLWNVFGSKLASKDGFAYSKAIYEKDIPNWNYETLSAFLKNPRGYIQGTKMSFAGLRKEEQRASVILYLRSLSDDMGEKYPLPELAKQEVEGKGENME